MTNPNQPKPTKMELKKENGKANGAFCTQKLRDCYSERNPKRLSVQSPYRASLQNQYCKMTRMRRRQSTAALSQRSVSKACVEAMPAPRALCSGSVASLCVLIVRAGSCSNEDSLCGRDALSDPGGSGHGLRTFR